MNLNDFVVLPNNKARSVKLNARNLRELRMETVTLAQESKEMEETLQQLKESMSREKEERGRLGGFRWKSGQSGALNNNALTNSDKRNKENRLQKQLSAGKVKIRVLKDETLTAPPAPPPPTISVLTGRKHRLRGKICGQCEVKTAGLMCAECGEDYCIGCFARFHQKGALKLHRMIPIQTDIQTHVSTLDVVSRFEKQIYPSSDTSTFTSPNTNPNPSPSSKPNSNPNPILNSNTSLNFISSPNPIHKGSVHPDSQTVVRGREWSPDQGMEAGPTLLIQHHTELSQVLVVNHQGEGELDAMEEKENGKEEEGFPASLLGGEYDEKESERSFQEALIEWRGERNEGGWGQMRGDTVWRLAEAQPVSVSAMGTQADLPPDREAGGGGGGRVPVRVEFTENSLTYLDRLLLKRYRRTPIETYRPLSALSPTLRSPVNAHIEEEMANSLTAEEEDLHRYCVSLFAVPASRGSTEPQITTPGSCLIVEVLDETVRDLNGVLGEQKTDNNRKFPSIQRVSNKRSTLVLHPDLTSVRSARLSPSVPSPPEPSQQSRAPAEPTATKKLLLSKPQILLSERSMKSLPSKVKPLPCPSNKTPRTSKTSIKTPTSKVQKRNCSPDIHKSNSDCGLPQLSSCPSLPSSQPEIPESSHTFPLSSPHTSPLSLTTSRSAKSEECPSPPPSISLSLRSTVTLSPSSATESTSLPEVYQSPPLPNVSESPLLLKQSRSPLLFQQPTSSPKLTQSASFGQESPKQSQHSLCDSELPLSPHRPQSPLSPVISPPLSSFQQSPKLPHSPKPPAKSLESVSSPSQKNPMACRLPLKPLSTLSLSNQSPPDVYSRYMSTPPRVDTLAVSSSSPLSSDHESTRSHLDTQRLQSDRPRFSKASQSPQLAVKMEEGPSVLSIDAGDEMSSDSLGLTPREEDSSDEEVKMDGSLEGWRGMENQQRNASIPHPEDSFAAVYAEPEENLQTDEPGLTSEPSMAVRALAQRAGSGSEQFCGLDGFLTLGLDFSSGHTGTPDYKHPTHTRQDSQHAINTGSVSWRPSSSLRTYTEEHLVITVMKNDHTEPTGIQMCSSTSTRGGNISAFELGTSGSWSSSRSGRSTPTPSCTASTNPRVESGLEFRPLSRAAQEIMEICGVDETGCEDPDLDTDIHTISCLDWELRLMAKDTGVQALVVATGNSESQRQHRNQSFTWDGVSEEQKEEEEEAQRDRQSVLSLP